MKKGILLTLTVVIACVALADKKSDPAPQKITDIDGNVYTSVTIGTQVWMVENLKTTKYRNGDPIPSITNGTEWSILITGAYCNQNNNPANATIQGRLYNWYALHDSRNIAPTGWHLPTDGELTILTAYLGGENVAGGKLKETGTTHWQNPNTAATNESGFSALPGGLRASTGIFYNLGINGNWWSTLESDAGKSYGRYLFNEDGIALRVSFPKGTGFSVRCLKD